MTSFPIGGPSVCVRPAFFSFIDLFAGIGGMRLGFEAAGGACVFTSEIDKFAQQTYATNFQNPLHTKAGDITRVPTECVPPHDVLLAGFPCQPFSCVGIGGKNHRGEPHGLADETSGTLFYEIARIIRHHRPQAFLLENVRNLLTHDKGRTFQVIRDTLEQLGYMLEWRVINAEGYVPQRRRRLFIAGFREDTGFRLGGITFRSHGPRLGSILQTTVDRKYTLSDSGWAWAQEKKAKHRAKGNGFGYTLVTAGDVAPTLIANYYSDYTFLLEQPGRNPRRLTPRECARLMGFPDQFKIPVSMTQAYRQFGNTVVVPKIGRAHV